MKHQLKIALSFILFVTVSLFSVNVIAKQKCCTAHCSLGDCSINSGASACVCGCDTKGNPHCEGQGLFHWAICVNPTQFGNLNGVKNLYNGFNSEAGYASAAIVDQMITLFQNNGYALHDNSLGGNVETYRNLRTELEAIQLSSQEMQSLNTFLGNCDSGLQCVSDEDEN